MSQANVPSQETLYRLLYERRWEAVVDLVYAHRASIPEDPLMAQAVARFVDAFFGALAEELAVAEGQAVLEKLFLLHTGGLFTLPAERFEAVAGHLVRLHADRPEAALGYARYCPDHPLAAAVLARHAAATPSPVGHPTDERVALAETTPDAGDAVGEAVVGLFRSQQEVEFYLAAREVFAAYVVYPNVALHSFLDFEVLRERLTPAERRYFFHGLVDCVVFDQHDGYRPRFCFELDSPLHDDVERQRKDRQKDRILAAAGQQLHRIRKKDPTAGRAEFAALLRSAASRTNG